MPLAEHVVQKGAGELPPVSNVFEIEVSTRQKYKNGAKVGEITKPLSKMYFKPLWHPDVFVDEDTINAKQVQ
jgi:hypothetical protein